MSEKDKLKLTKRQVEVLDALFFEGTTEESVLEEHNVSLNVCRKWLGDKSFMEAFEFRMQSAHRQGQLVVAKYASFAALKLVDLMNTGKGETARKACLDLMAMPMSKLQTKSKKSEDFKSVPITLNSELAGKLNSKATLSRSGL